MSKRSKLLRWAVLFALATPPRASRAENVDPKIPLRVVSGRPAVKLELVRHPVLAWQARVLEPLLSAPVADTAATFVVAHASGLIIEFEANGRARRTVRAASNLALGPILLASRRRLVVTGDAEAIVFLPSGRIESRQRLAFRELDSTASALSTSDGGALVAAGARFARIDPTGSVTARGGTRESLRGVFEWRGLGVLVERGGRVLGLGHAGDVFDLGNLGRAVRASELRGNRLLALVGDRELVELDLATRVQRTLWSDPPLVPRGLFALPNGELRVIASNLVIALEPAGRETFRVVQPGTSGESSVAILGDTRGAMLVATGGLDLRLVSESGEVIEIPGTACPDPLAPTPLANGLVVASCRSGLLFGVSGKAR